MGRPGRRADSGRTKLPGYLPLQDLAWFRENMCAWCGSEGEERVASVMFDGYPSDGKSALAGLLPALWWLRFAPQTPENPRLVAGGFLLCRTALAAAGWQSLSPVLTTRLGLLASLKLP